LIGRSLISRPTIVVELELLVVSISAGWALTVTDSACAATFSAGLYCAFCPIVSVSRGFTSVAKPRASTVSRYSPGGSARKKYSPFASVVISRACPVARLSTRTRAFGTGSPFGSRIRPERSAVFTCAAAGLAIPTTRPASSPASHTITT
jgi:hypothetical protein